MKLFKLSILVALLCLVGIALAISPRKVIRGKKAPVSPDPKATCQSLFKAGEQASLKRSKRWAQLAVPLVMAGAQIISSIFGGKQDKAMVERLNAELEATSAAVREQQMVIRGLTDQNGQLIVENEKQAIKLVYLNEKMTEAHEMIKAKGRDTEARVQAIEKVFSEFKNMTDAQIDALGKEYELLGLEMIELRKKVETRMDDLNRLLFEHEAQLNAFQDRLQAQLQTLEDSATKTNIKLEDMQEHLGGVETAITQIGEAHAIQTDKLANICGRLDGIEKKTDLIIENLNGTLVLKIEGKLKGSVGYLRRQINETMKGLVDHAKEIRNEQHMQDLIDRFGKAVDRIHYLITYRDQRLKYVAETGEWEPREEAKKWANFVMNPKNDDYRIEDLLEALDQLAMGTARDAISSTNSIFDVYKMGARQYREDYNKRVAVTKEVLAELETASPVQSERFYMQLLFDEFRQLQSQATLVRSQAVGILGQSGVEEELRRESLLRTPVVPPMITPEEAIKIAPEPESEDYEEEATNAPEPELTKDEDEQKKPNSSEEDDLPPANPLTDDTFGRRRRSAVRLTKKQQKIIKDRLADIKKQKKRLQKREAIIDRAKEHVMNESFAICTSHYGKMSRQLNKFQSTYEKSADGTFTNPPRFFMLKKSKKAGSKTRIGFTGREAVAASDRKLCELRVVKGQKCPESIRVKPTKTIRNPEQPTCQQSVTGCRLCTDCTLKGVKHTKTPGVKLQCWFRAPILNKPFGKVIEESFPREDAEFKNAESNMRNVSKTSASNGHDWLKERLALTKPDKEPDDDEPEKRPKSDEPAIVVVTGMLRIPSGERDHTMICGVSVGQPRFFDYNLVAAGASALSADVCERATGRYLRTLEIPHANSNDFKQGMFKVVRLSNIFKERIRPRPAQWITGIGFTTTGFNGDTLTLEMETDLF